VFVDTLELHWRVIAFAAALAPGALLFWLLWRPAGAAHLRYALACATALGVLLVFPVIGAELLLHALLPSTGSPVQDAVISAFAVAALVEEGFKFALFAGFALRHEDRETPADAVRFAIAIALGFALLENLLHVWETAGWAWVALVRALTAVPSHAFDGLLMGTLAAAALSRRRGRFILFALALLAPIASHGLYDALLLPLEHLPADGKAPLRVGFALLLLSQGIAAFEMIRHNRRSEGAGRAICIPDAGS
jgi:RsiW-degrading membrane proteinase PrsW (M82 family)